MSYIVTDGQRFATGNIFIPDVSFRGLAKVYSFRVFAAVQAWRRKHSGYLEDHEANWRIEEI